jgi:hypothetical protein
VAAKLRTAVPDLLMIVAGAALAWPTGRVATGLCDFETDLCRVHAGATWIWLVFTGALLLFAFGIWRLATLRRRLDRPAVGGSVPVDVPDDAASRRLAAVIAPREPVSPAPPPPPAPAGPACANPDEAEAVDAFAWLKAQPAASRDVIAAHWNWDYDLEMLHWLVEQPDCDGGVAAGVFWRAVAYDGPDEARVFEIARSIAGRFERTRVPVRYGFDDRDADDLYAAAVDAFSAGAIDWNPSFLPVRSSGPEPTLADLPSRVRPAVLAFLRHIGGG